MESTTRRDRMKNLVGFLVGDVRYAVDILKVREIINPLPIVELPKSPPSVIGVADHRGEVVPIVDLRRRFGLPTTEATRRTKWIIVSVDGRSAGLVVDAVTDVFGEGVDARREVPRLKSGDDARGIAAVYAREDGLTFVVDVAAIAEPTRAIDVGQVTGGG